MAHFAHIDENNIVTEVLVVPDEQEHRGQEYLNELGLEGRWIQTSYNDNIRGSYAGIGDYYNESLDIFEITNYVNWLENGDDINA